jgi:Family of unknown function (DUF6111)
MIRPVLIELLLFLAPFVFYIVYLWVTKASTLDRNAWPLKHVLSLAIVALTLVLGSFIYFAHYTGTPPGSTYVPAHIENGKLIPETVK